jgi:MFS family permease
MTWRRPAASHLSLWFGGFAVGCLLLGTLSDRLGRRKPVIIVASHIYGAIWLLLLAGVRMPVEVSYALFAVLGLATASFSLTWACAKEVNPPMLSGMSTSVTNMGSFLAAALFQPIVGWVMDLGWKGEMVAGACLRPGGLARRPGGCGHPGPHRHDLQLVDSRDALPEYLEACLRLSRIPKTIRIKVVVQQWLALAL